MKLREQLALIGQGGDGVSWIPGAPQIVEVSKIIEVKDDAKIKEMEQKIQSEIEAIK